MSATIDYVKCECQQCGDSIEIPGDYLGYEHECPHCHKTTVLKQKLSPPPPVQPPPRQAAQPEPYHDPVTPLRVRRSFPTRYTVFVAIGFLIGLAMIFGAMLEADAKTVYQQISGRLLGIGGVIICGLSVLLEAVSPVLRFLWEVSLRLESIEQRLAKLTQKR